MVTHVTFLDTAVANRLGQTFQPFGPNTFNEKIEVYVGTFDDPAGGNAVERLDDVTSAVIQAIVASALSSVALRLVLVVAMILVSLNGTSFDAFNGTTSDALSVDTPTPPVNCPPEGRGGDSELNRQKNRRQTLGALRDVLFNQIVNLNRIAVNKKGRQTWTDAERQRVAAVEDGDRIAAVGYIFDAKYSAPETCNCSFTAEPWLELDPSERMSG